MSATSTTSKGIIFAVPRKYEHICYSNIVKLRLVFNNNLPIEIWLIGNEISPYFLELFKMIPNLTIKDVNNYNTENTNWKGFQVKAFIIKHTSFEEVILCDADITFFQDPSLIFLDENYIKTGSFFFRDLEKWKFYNLHETSDNFQSISHFNLRKNFI